MWGSGVLDTVLGLAFVLFAVALLSSVVVEWWATIQRKRAKFLLRGVRAMLVDDLGSRRALVVADGCVGGAARGAAALPLGAEPHGRRSCPR